MIDVTATDLKALSNWDTPTICNALEIINPERRGFGYTIKPFSCLSPRLPPIIGYARTAKIRAAQPTKSSIDRLTYYEYVAADPMPAIIIVEDIDPTPGYGAFWGEVQTNVHKGLGAVGCVTYGAYRDINDSAPGFQLLGGMVGPSHAYVHLVEIDCRVNIHGMKVDSGDIIHADQHGAVVIPRDAVAKISTTIDMIIRREAIILDAARAPDFNLDKLKKAIGNQTDIH